MLKKNTLSLNVTKTTEMNADYRKSRTEHAPIVIDGAVVEQLSNCSTTAPSMRMGACSVLLFL